MTCRPTRAARSDHGRSDSVGPGDGGVPGQLREVDAAAVEAGRGARPEPRVRAVREGAGGRARMRVFGAAGRGRRSLPAVRPVRAAGRQRVGAALRLVRVPPEGQAAVSQDGYSLVVVPGHEGEYVPFDFQAEFLEYMDGHRPERRAEAMCVWPRRHGKDLTGLQHLLTKAHDKVGMYWHALPTYEQARKSCWTAYRNDLGKRLMDSVFPREIVRRPAEWAPEASMVVELRNGSMVQFVGADSIDSVVGAGILGLNASEYSLWHPTAYDLIRPMLRESGGWAAFFMTPRGHNHARRQSELMRRDPRKFVSHKDVFSAGKYTPEAARALIEDELRSGMLPELVRQEYMTDFAAAMVGSYWGDAMELLEKRGSLGKFEHSAGPAFVSWDLGMSDAFAMWAYVPTAAGAD